MSIRSKIQALVKEQPPRLVCLPPLVKSAASIRTMFVSIEIDSVVWPPSWPRNREGYRLSQFRGTLDAFTEGVWISVAEDPFKKPHHAFLARVHPVNDEIWDIRSIDPKPGIRAFGAFAEKDTFVALTFEYRENLSDPQNWNAEIDRCKTAWSELFKSETPFQGANLNAYLSGNYYAV